MELIYKLTIDEDGANAISFIGHRYCWSKALIDAGYDVAGSYKVAEHVAWQLQDAFTEDTKGNHGYFPMLDRQSVLYAELDRFLGSIV